MENLYTIGYSSFDLRRMADVLCKYGINLIIDVRSLPYSTHYQDYNKEPFEHFLKDNSIYYRNYTQEFGAQQTEKQFFSDEGFLDFKLFTKSDRFLHGFEKVQANIKKGFTIALMCAEKDPAECHRSIMITRSFSERDFSIKHILSDGSFETQDSIEHRLLNKYFPNRHQLTFLGDELPDAELIARAYRLRNSEIGFRREEKKHEAVYNRVYEKVGRAIL